MEAQIMKRTNYSTTSTFTKSKPSIGFSVITCPKTLSSPEFRLAFALMTIRFTCSVGIIWMLNTKRDTSMTCMKFSSTWLSKKEDLMVALLSKGSMNFFPISKTVLNSNLKKDARLRLCFTKLILLFPTNSGNSTSWARSGFCSLLGKKLVMRKRNKPLH